MALLCRHQTRNAPTSESHKSESYSDLVGLLLFSQDKIKYINSTAFSAFFW